MRTKDNSLNYFAKLNGQSQINEIEQQQKSKFNFYPSSILLDLQLNNINDKIYLQRKTLKKSNINILQQNQLLQKNIATKMKFQGNKQENINLVWNSINSLKMLYREFLTQNDINNIKKQILQIFAIFYDQVKYFKQQNAKLIKQRQKIVQETKILRKTYQKNIDQLQNQVNTLNSFMRQQQYILNQSGKKKNYYMRQNDLLLQKNNCVQEKLKMLEKMIQQKQIDDLQLKQYNQDNQTYSKGEFNINCQNLVLSQISYNTDDRNKNKRIHLKNINSEKKYETNYKMKNNKAQGSIMRC